MRKKDVLIIGAGGVAHVAAHKVAQNNDVLGDLCIASRTLGKCDHIIDSINRKGSSKNPRRRIYSRQIDAKDVPALVQLIEETKSDIVINLGQSFVNMSVLEACIQTGVAYMDTSIHEEPDKVCEDPPWYGNYEWKRKDRCREKGITAILGVGFDPGVVNAWCAQAARNHLDIIDTIDIMDVNAGSHGKYFATNFDPEINFREFKKVWSWIDRKWVERKVHSVKRVHEFPVVGKQTVYLTGHDEVHSLSKNLDVNSIRFWMGFSNQYINVFTVLTKLGLTSNLPVRTAEGIEVVPLKVMKALLPQPLLPRAELYRKDLHRNAHQREKRGRGFRTVHVQHLRPCRLLPGGGGTGNKLHRRCSAGGGRDAYRTGGLGCQDHGQCQGARPRPLHRALSRHGTANRNANGSCGYRPRCHGAGKSLRLRRPLLSPINHRHLS